MRTPFITTTALCLALGSSLASASSGGGYDQSEFSQAKVDKQYEAGKSYYKARQADGSRLEYCIKSDSNLTKLSRKSVKPFKRGAAMAFVDSLYSCNDPTMKIADILPADQADAVLYYLNKRFKLRLADS